MAIFVGTVNISVVLTVNVEGIRCQKHSAEGLAERGHAFRYSKKA